MKIINLSICLSDIPKDKIKKSEKNSKVYVNLALFERQEKNQYGDTHSISVPRSKEERENKVPIIYVGSGTLYDSTPTPPISAQEIDNLEPITDTDPLGF